MKLTFMVEVERAEKLSQLQPLIKTLKEILEKQQDISEKTATKGAKFSQYINKLSINRQNL